MVVYYQVAGKKVGSHVVSPHYQSTSPRNNPQLPYPFFTCRPPTAGNIPAQANRFSLLPALHGRPRHNVRRFLPRHGWWLQAQDGRWSPHQRLVQGGGRLHPVCATVDPNSSDDAQDSQLPGFRVNSINGVNSLLIASCRQFLNEVDGGDKKSEKH